MTAAAAYVLHYWPTPNGHKITLMLEELGVPYTLQPVNISAGDQFQPAFLAISPNNRMPALVDPAPADGGEPISVFESGAILVYLAEKHGAFLPSDLRGRKTVLEWLFWQVGGLGPMAGQNHHFGLYAPEKIPYAIDRYTREVQRLLGVLDRQLAKHAHVAGNDYSVADMAIHPWVNAYDKAPLDLSPYPHLQRWHAEIAARPAVQRAYALKTQVNPDAGKPLTDEERKHLFGR